MFHGLIAAIPSGWFLCNGSNDTPDLRDRFIQGAANGVEAGATGGSNTATPGNHSNHTVTQPSTHSALATHQHAGNIANAGVGMGSLGGNPFGQGSGSYGSSSIPGSGIAGQVPDLVEAISGGTPNAHSGTAVNAHSVHSTSDSRPTFFVLLFIMKA
jgi:hypothetical protein